VKFRVLAIALLAALFGVQAPVCTLFCAEGSGAAHAAEPETPPPCHGARAPADPADPADSHTDCEGCDEGVQAVVLSEAQVAAPSPVVALVSLPLGFESAFNRRRPTPSPKTPSQLPPPDIILLKSSLLL